MRLHKRFKPLLGAAILAAATAASAAQGLDLTETPSWPVLQARVNLMVSRAGEGWSGELWHAALLADYYLERHDEGAQASWRGGLRATTGVVFGSLGPSVAVQGGRSRSWLAVAASGAAHEREAWPYVGLGYTGLAPQGAWGISADLGLAWRQGAAASEVSRTVFGLRGWEGTLRRLDAMPLLQLGVHYRF